jgi:hypothetical protein
MPWSGGTLHRNVVELANSRTLLNRKFESGVVIGTPQQTEFEADYDVADCTTARLVAAMDGKDHITPASSSAPKRPTAPAKFMREY